MDDAMDASVGLMQALCDLLRSHEDYSLYASLERLRSVTETNPDFEVTLKRNAAGYYCRSYISENADELYMPELLIIFDEVRRASASGGQIDRQAIKKRIARNTERFFDTPLAEMAKKSAPPLSSALLTAAAIIESVSFST